MYLNNTDQAEPIAKKVRNENKLVLCSLHQQKLVRPSQNKYLQQPPRLRLQFPVALSPHYLLKEILAERNDHRKTGLPRVLFEELSWRWNSGYDFPIRRRNERALCGELVSSAGAFKKWSMKCTWCLSRESSRRAEGV